METQTYARKTFYVEAVQITKANFEAVAEWTNGEIEEILDKKLGKMVKVIKVAVYNPMNPLQSQARLGDWVLTSNSGFKIYTNRAFENSFELHLPARTVESLGAKMVENVKVDSVTQVEEDRGPIELPPVISMDSAPTDPNTAIAEHTWSVGHAPEQPTFEVVPDEEVATLETIEE